MPTLTLLDEHKNPENVIYNETQSRKLANPPLLKSKISKYLAFLLDEISCRKYM